LICGLAEEHDTLFMSLAKLYRPIRQQPEEIIEISLQDELSADDGHMFEEQK